MFFFNCAVSKTIPYQYHSLFQAPVRIGVIFKHLRKLIDSLLEKKLENPRMNLEGKAKHPDTNFTLTSPVLETCMTALLE